MKTPILIPPNVLNRIITMTTITIMGICLQTHTIRTARRTTIIAATYR